MKNVKYILNLFNKTNIYIKIILSSIFLYLLYKFYISIFKFIYNSTKSQIETFKNKEQELSLSSQKEKFLTLSNNNIYDDFYAVVYDELMTDENRLYFEFTNLIDFGKIKNNNSSSPSTILDIGCGNSHLVNMFNDENYNCIGMDKSKYMINNSIQKYPNLKNKLKINDGLVTQTFTPNSFSHILCLYFTIYEIEDKKSFLQNCYLWLNPGGYLFLHLVNKTKFNPIVNAGDPLEFISPQKYAKKRITNSIVEFNDFTYKSNFSLNNSTNKALFNEIFEDNKNNKIRKHEHNLDMPTQKEILSMAKQVGFIMEAKIDMVYCQYEYQYIYVLKKPN